MLTPSLAQEIASETSAIIGFNVLITDRDGIVIGSGDTTRIGGFHEASVNVVRTGMAAAHGDAEARALTGVKPGVTLPVLIEGETVGTVGITGAPSDVERFGKVVRHQTEILLRESLLLRSRLLHEKAVDHLLDDVAHFDAGVVEQAVVVARGLELGYDLRLPRLAIVVAAPAVTPDVLRAVRGAFADPDHVVGTVRSGRFVVLYRLPQSDPVPRALAACRAAGDRLRRALGVAVGMGVGDPAASVAELHESYLDAVSAVGLGGANDVVHVGDVRVPRLLSDCSPSGRARFTDPLLARLREQPDWPVLRETLTLWCESGFNLVRAAGALHVHRNTMVYRLRKLDHLLGRSTQDFRFMIVLYLACQADELD